jgi:transcriptional regulator with XRE-family HTH domain
MNKTIGELITYWRKVRNKSQMQLALEANVSTRHLSFVESGRAQPSKNLILRLANVLQLSYRQSNLLLNTAGFIAFYPNHLFDDEMMKPVRTALDFILAKHEPFPALVVNASYDILLKNQSFIKTMKWFVGEQAFEKYPNIYRLVFAKDGLMPYMAQWDFVSCSLLTRLQEEALTSQN